MGVAAVTAAALAAAAESDARFRYVATASQPGIVGYRDPLGAVSPDGAWLAYTEGRHLRLRRLEGGAVVDLLPADRNLIYLAWLPDARRLASFGRNPDTGESGWRVHDVSSRSVATLWPERPEAARWRQLQWSADGRTAVAVAIGDGGTALVTLDAEGRVTGTRPSELRLSFPAVSADGRTTACLAEKNGRPRLSRPCGEAPARDAPEVYGPVAFSPDGALLYHASPNEQGTLDLWSLTAASGERKRLTGFGQDTYAPSVTRDGRVLFKVKDYRAVVARIPAAGGVPDTLAAFQSETPSWDPTGRLIGITFGSWRRVVDDFHYPDIAQDVGILSLDEPAPARRPARVVSATSSEDQSLCWSPNGRFIAFHSHFGPSDDIWLVPADGSRPPRQITTGGSETGWPRWSPDGRWIVYTTDTARLEEAARRLPSWERPREKNAIVLVGVDQETGEVTRPAGPIALEGFAGQPLHAEWSPDGARVFFDANDGGSERSLQAVPRGGGRPTLIHRFECEQGFSGIGVSPDGRWIAFVAPAPDGHMQIFRVSTAGGTAEALTSDPTHKTQPSYSPDGRTLALTVWSYDAQFWQLQ
jgi:hypothetical protein